MILRLASLAFLIAATSASCASIVTGASDTVRIESVPPGADFVTNSGHQGKTPAEITIPDKLLLTITCSSPGYQDTTVTLPSRMSGWFLGNLLLGGIVGIVLDLASGNWRTHDGEIVVPLTPIAADSRPRS